MPPPSITSGSASKNMLTMSLKSDRRTRMGDHGRRRRVLNLCIGDHADGEAGATLGKRCQRFDPRMTARTFCCGHNRHRGH